MLGGHLDSWHAATGATDNAIGCAIDDGGGADPEGASACSRGARSASRCGAAKKKGCSARRPT